MLHVRPTQRPEDFVQWGRVAREIAKAGLPLRVHTTLEGTADGFLDQIEQINKEFPIRTLRWATYHADQLTQAHIERMKRLGIAHTRRNAFFVFQENNLGSIQPGKLANLVVLDRDYLTMPADQIKDIKPVLTMVGGKIVYDAAGATWTR